ncbi:pyridoxal phosphate-dependent transferase [Fusarium flagelliforme]|uniref:pyridoxal phosphate-dependent transferase n=1 Tax=Fusarium flagelliforme TaxID=2675880 RepID=UPI001E8CFD7F|nr:pyridoxal phosphate-dependent transferase [Fusarium flagelliforme]KAH7185313.1 pyridoxal phosphate-dependent transferase [Fusarium flagelliforme]
MKAELGSSLPPGDKHAVSVYIPTWKDTVAWARREPDLISQLKTGYPRFFVPLVVGQLAEQLLQRISSESASDELPPELRVLLAEPGRSAMLLPASHHARMCEEYLNTQDKGQTFVLQADFSKGVRFAKDLTKKCTLDEIYAVVYPRGLAVEAKAFWQHTGFGVSSRRATYWLENAPFLNHASRSYTGHLPDEEASESKLEVQKRIADLFSTDTNRLDVDDIFLYPSGMSSISHTADTIQHLNTNGKATVAIFGFLYVDTFKVLSKIYGFNCKLYGATPSDLDTLEADLADGLQLSALFTEFPGNPLLGSVDLERLQKLSIDHDFLFVVDDTVATSVNVGIISYCDVVCTSLTKMFSGSCNVMGGSVALNPQSRLFPTMKQLLKDGFSDTYFPLDVIVMNKNSADFEERVITASENAERTVKILRNHKSIEQVYYPKGNPTQNIYERYKRPGKGYGYLLSIRFKTPEAAIAFHDALDVAKGPSLGTNFTLCCAYTLFAHFSELDWAAKYGVVEHLVRISVGIESQEALDELVKTALDAALHALGTRGEFSYMTGKL